METQEVKDYYNQTLKKNKKTYEFSRWFSSDQAATGYEFTKEAICNDVLPLLKSDAKILEIGPGPGTWTKLMLERYPNLDMHLVDISDEMLRQAQETLRNYSRIKFTVSDMLEFKSHEQYDIFFSSRAIEYVPQKREAIRNITRAIKKGGFGYIITKMPHYERLRIFGRRPSSFHSNQIKPQTLSLLIENEGCKVEIIRPVTIVFPRLHSGKMDRILHTIVSRIPLKLSSPVCESYAVLFRKV